MANGFADDSLVHYTLHYPPYWHKSDKEFEGYHAKLSRLIYQEANLNVKMKEVPYARISNFNFSKDVAIIAYGSNPATDSKLRFPIPMTTIKLNIYSLNPSPPTEISKLKNKTVAIKRGYPLGSFTSILEDKSINVLQLKTVKQGIKMLLAKRVDYIITLDDPYREEVHKLNKFYTKVYSAELSSLKGWPIAVVRKHPNSLEIYSKIKKAYNKLIQDNIIEYKNERLLLKEDHK